MTPDLTKHYAARLSDAADQYERDPLPESAWALLRALALARLHKVPQETYDPVVSALEPLQGEILDAALAYGLSEDYAGAVHEYARRADYALDEWEDQADGFITLHFELQTVHDWLADRVLESEALLPRLASRLEGLGSALGKLAEAIEQHRSLFSVGLPLHDELLAHADQGLLTPAYKLRVGGASTTVAHERGEGRTIPFLRSDGAEARSYARAADSSGVTPAHRSIILDASFVRACPTGGEWLRKLAAHTQELVCIDALVFELCSADDQNQWASTTRKLAAVVDQVECWMHVSEMLRYELQSRQALRQPCDAQLTSQFRAYIAAGSTRLADPNAPSNAGTQREVEGGAALRIAIDACLPLVGEIRQRISNKPRTAVEAACYAFVNNPQYIRFVLGAGGEDAVFAGCQVTEDWVAWHHAKWFLAALCEAARSAQADDGISKITKRLFNRKHDGDYLISLKFADAIASNETGEMLAFSRWMYGESRAFITPRDLVDP